MFAFKIHAHNSKVQHSKISGCFDDATTARLAEQTILRATDLKANQIHVVAPNDRHSHSPAEDPYHDENAPRTMLGDHILGIAQGALLGVIGAYSIFRYLPAFTENGHNLFIIICAFIGACLGFLLSLALSAKHNHAKFSAKMQDELENGKWLVIADTHNSDEKTQAKQCLSAHADTIFYTRP